MSFHSHVRHGALLAIAAAAALLPLARPARAEAWVQWEAPDGRAFIMPQGWSSEGQAGLFELTRHLTGDRALVLYAPPEGRSAREFGDSVFDDIRRECADFAPTVWEETNIGTGRLLTCTARYTDEGVPMAGLCCVAAGEELTSLILVSSPAGSGSSERLQALLVTLLRSGLADLIGGDPVEIADLQWPALPPSRLEAAGRAFVFVLEFALTAPFTAEQETLILAELLDGWAKLPEEGFAEVEAYNQLAQAILHGDGDALEDLRGDLVAITTQWLEETDQSDPAVRAVREQLESKGRVVAAGEPALTEVAAAAYAEMYALSEQLAEDPNAVPSDVDPRAIDSTRQRLEAAWGTFDRAEREAAASCPALWLTLRAALTFGAPEEGQTARERIASVSARATEPADGGGDGGGGGAAGGTGDPIDRMLQSNTLLAIQQQTFNQYMWSRGFRQTPFGW